MEGQRVRLEDILSDTDIVVAITEYSATAPLIDFSQKLPWDIIDSGTPRRQLEIELNKALAVGQAFDGQDIRKRSIM